MIAVYQLPQGTLFSAMLSLLTILIFRNRGSPGFDFTRPKLSTVFPLEKWPQVSIGRSQKHFCSIHLVPLKIKEYIQSIVVGFGNQYRPNGCSLWSGFPIYPSTLLLSLEFAHLFSSGFSHNLTASVVFPPHPGFDGSVQSVDYTLAFPSLPYVDLSSDTDVSHEQGPFP